MMPSKAHRAGSWLTAYLLITLSAGCSGTPEGNLLPEDSDHIKNFFNLVANYSSSHKRTPPASIEELKAWAKKEGKQVTDDSFKSPRDGQDYVILPGAMGRFIVYEQTGVNGKRYMVNPGGVFVDATEEQIESVKNTMPKARAGGGMRGGGAPK